MSTGIIALDLGGTKLAVGLFNARGTLLRTTVTQLRGRNGPELGKLIQRRLQDMIRFARRKKLAVSGLGVSVPGIVSKGRVWAPNVGGWEDYPLGRELESSAPRGCQCVIESDRACYILGETWRGAAKGCRDAIFLAVGTGIGAGILVDGRVLGGAYGVAGAIGWLALDRPFRREYSDCGCFEYHASGPGLVKVAQQMIEKQKTCRSGLREKSLATSREVFGAYERGDPVAQAVIRQAIEFWGMAVANLVSLFNPEKIIFGGGVFGPAIDLLAAIRAEAAKWAQPLSLKRVALVPSVLGGKAGLYGAAYLALQGKGQRGRSLR